MKVHVNIIQMGISSRKLYIKQDSCSKIRRKFQVEKHLKNFPLTPLEVAGRAAKRMSELCV